MTQRTQRVVDMTALDVAALLPPTVAGAAGTLDLPIPANDGDGDLYRRVGLWRSGGHAYEVMVDISPLSHATAGLDVTVAAGAPGTADAIAGGLHDALLPAMPAHGGASPRRRRRRRLPAILATATVVVIALAVVAANLLAPPKPVDVADAVAQFREQTAASETAGTAAEQAAPTQRAGKRTHQQRRAAVAAARRPAPGSQSRSDQRANDTTAPAASTAAVPQQTTAPAASTRQRQQETRAAAAPTQQEPTPRQEPAGPARPEAGVYTYSTSGYEEIDRPHERHDYPEQTAMSLRHTDCGFVARWQPLETRWDEMDLCRAQPASALNRLSTSREFFGRRMSSEYRCTRDSVAYSTRPEGRFSARCDDGSTTITASGRVVGREIVRVGADSVEAVHVAISATLEGETNGSWHVDRWLAADTGLLLRVVGETDVTSASPVGQITYTERVTNQLQSMTPQR